MHFNNTVFAKEVTTASSIQFQFEDSEKFSSFINNVIFSQVEIVGQLNSQMVDMVGGMVDMVGEEPEPKSGGIPEHEEEDEEYTRVS